MSDSFVSSPELVLFLPDFSHEERLQIVVLSVFDLQSDLFF
jgi:hypothetical protein